MTGQRGDGTIPAALRDRLASALAAIEAGDAAAYLDAAGVAWAPMPPPTDDGANAPASDDAADAVNEAAALLAAGEALLAAVLGADAGSRDTALDLLTADALVTHAFERAADAPAALPALADAAMRRIALLADAAG
ncbi:MAG: hypothetical protein ACYC2G_16480 [Gemmatimonadaceae bacterium]